ncbi:MAG: glutathione peroxidase [Gammaproteobacteria bacterium]|nr:glutathione peroxidase [Gammaproteobacteria bacterium]
MSAFHALTLAGLDGAELPLAQFKDRVLLVVNVASECGLTQQYTGLQALYEQYKERGLSILAVPCNQFGKQEPGDPQEIQDFCTERFGVTFTLTEKLQVNGQGNHPLYRLLAGEGAEFPGEITWNFEKFLVDGSGRVLARFSPRTEPDDAQLVQAIEDALAAQAA